MRDHHEKTLLQNPVRPGPVRHPVGVLLGVFYPKLAVDMKPLGDGFIKLVKMIIAPVIF